ncbi:MAG: SAM-dependent methyltransferase [Bacteroidales bacterium]|nr:SAM-dependent methyltransferase [Bacteroidales bacterium]
MGVFQFKKFSVVNERSAMKVNTDGVLLGAAMTIRPGDRCFLDVGTGTGTIALMVAQRVNDEIPGQAGNDKGQAGNDKGQVGNDIETDNEVRIDAIDIDEPSASEAAMNFAGAPWAGSLHAHNKSLEDFASSSELMYDLIFSNPPYFEDSLTAPDERKSTARHTSDGLSYRDIFEFAKDRLNDGGHISLVLPADQEHGLARYARMCGFHLFRILRVRTVPRKSPSRIIAEFSKERCQEPSDTVLTIQNEGKYTQEYLSLTHDFYLFA